MPQCPPVTFLPPATRTVTPRSPSDPIIVIHKVPSFHRAHHTLSRRASAPRREKKIETRATHAVCAFRASRRSSPGTAKTDESSAYPSRPRDGLRISSTVQRRRDPWRHRELNPRPHIRAAEYHRRGATVRSAIWVLSRSSLANFNPSGIRTVHARWCPGVFHPPRISGL